MYDTSFTLLHRLCQPDADVAWIDFVQKYSPLILRYARRCGLQNNEEAQDCLQQSLITLLRVMPEFQYDAERGKFRSYVFSIVRHQALAMMRRHARQGEVASADDLASTARSAEEAGTDNVTLQQVLLDEAWTRLCTSGRIGPQTQGAFEDYVFKSGEAGEVARKHAITPNALYQIRSRVIAMLKEEVAVVEEELYDTVCR